MATQDDIKVGMAYLDEVEKKIKSAFGDDIAAKNLVELFVQRGGPFQPQELGFLTGELKNQIDMARKRFGDYQPGLGRASFLHGWVSGFSTNLKEAIPHYEEALQYGYDEGETLFRISSLYCDYLDKPSKAIPYLQKLLETEMGKNIPALPGWVYFQLGRAYRDMGNKEKATESFNKVIEIEGATSELGLEASKKIDLLKSSSGGCFIATAVYDSPNAPEIKTLKQFRDEILLNSPVGRLFIVAYYRISPSVAQIVSKSKIIKKAVKYIILNPIVKIIKTRI